MQAAPLYEVDEEARFCSPGWCKNFGVAAFGSAKHSQQDQVLFLRLFHPQLTAPLSLGLFHLIDQLLPIALRTLSSLNHPTD